MRPVRRISTTLSGFSVQDMESSEGQVKGPGGKPIYPGTPAVLLLLHPSPSLPNALLRLFHRAQQRVLAHSRVFVDLGNLGFGHFAGVDPAYASAPGMDVQHDLG